MGSIKLIQKRAYKRIPTSLVVKFLHCDSTCYGIVMNISEKGMCINTGICPPFDSKFKLFILLKYDHLEVPVKVRWATKTNHFYDSMGVEILNPSKEYLQIVNHVKNSIKSA